MDTGIEFNIAEQLTTETPEESSVANPNKIPTTESNEVERSISEDKSASDTFDSSVDIERVFGEMSMFRSVEQYQQIIETVLVEPETAPVQSETVPMVDEDITVDEIGEKVFGIIPSFGSIRAYEKYF